MAAAAAKPSGSWAVATGWPNHTAEHHAATAMTCHRQKGRHDGKRFKVMKFIPKSKRAGLAMKIRLCKSRHATFKVTCGGRRGQANLPAQNALSANRNSIGRKPHSAAANNSCRTW